VIVVDTNVLAHCVITGPGTAVAEAVFRKDSAWRAPGLWRSEFRNLLVRRLHRGETDFPTAVTAMEDARRLLEEESPEVGDRAVLTLAQRSGCTAYDCEFVALAEALGAVLVTRDRQVLRAFPGVAVTPEEFARGR